MKYFQDLAKHELGTFERINTLAEYYNTYKSKSDDFIPFTLEELIDIRKDSKEFERMRHKKKSMFEKEEQLTEDELVELSLLSEKLKDYESILVSGNGSNYLSWETPSGFVVKYKNFMQYQKTVSGFIHGYGKSGYIGHVLRESTNIPNSREFISGISPNIIHSMDAAQLAITCVEHHGTFAGIHDSYSTHACDVEDLLHTSKKVFIDLYKDGLFLEKITYELLSRHDNFDNVNRPANGNLNVDSIYESDTFFS